MMVLEKAGARGGDGRDDGASSRTKVSVDLTADIVMARADLIDRVFDFVFDVLGVAHIELRIREDAYEI